MWFTILWKVIRWYKKFDMWVAHFIACKTTHLSSIFRIHNNKLDNMSQNSTTATEIATPQSPNYSPQSPDNRPVSPIIIPDNLEIRMFGVESEKPMPPYVKSTEESGVEARSFELAQLFMGKHGRLARRCRTRGELSALYLSTQATWMPIDWGSDINEQRLFKQVLFAIAHGMKLVRVVNKGRSLSWNRYRDNFGKPIERTERPARGDNDRRRDRRSYRDEDRYDRRDRRDYDRRDSRYHTSDTAFLEEGPDGKMVLARDQERAAFESAQHRWENECRRRDEGRRNQSESPRHSRCADCYPQNQENRGEVEAVDLSYDR